jgi:cobalamin biosynthesis protein CobT
MLGLEAKLLGYEDLLDQFPNVQTTQDSADLAERLLKRWEQRQRETPAPKKEQPSQPDGAGGDSEGSSGTGQDQQPQSGDDADGGSQDGSRSDQAGEQSQPDSSGDSKSGNTDGSPSTDASTGGDPASAQQPDGDPAQSSNAMSNCDGDGTPGSLISQALDDAIREQMASIDIKRTYRPYTREHDRIVAIESAGAEEVQNLLQADRDGVRRLRRGLTNALRSREKRWWQDGQLRGMLSPRQLHRLCLDRCRIDVFRKRAVVQGKSTAIAILLDASGSMSQRKMDVARRALRVLLEALADLRVPTEALTFTTGNEVDLQQLMSEAGGNMHQMRERYGRLSNLEIGIVQRFGEPVAQAWQRLPRIRGTGLTPLGEAMQVAASRLAVRREERRILLVLSDGKAGCEGGSDVAEAHAVEMARRIQRAGIEVIGVGILDDHIAGVVDAALVVQDLTQLPAQLCKLLSQTLMKGVHRVG